MRHVDEGTIHAWLDEQITDPAEAAWIEAHVRECADCRARLAGEQAAFDGARTLLDATAVAAERPSFDALAAKAGRHVTEGGAPAAEPTRRRERLVQLSWAASLALAVGLGWTARELTDRDETRPLAPAAIAEPAPAADARVGNAEPSQTSPRPASATRPADATAGAPPAPQSSSPAPSRQTANADAAPQRTAPSSEAAPAAPAAQSDASASAAETVAQLAAPPTLTAPTAALPAAPPPPAAPAQPVAAPAALASRLERTAVADGQWRAVPRTEAAARTGMPLYGIDGLEPQYTALSADGAVVRTLYRLQSGEQVELIQRRNVPGAVPAGDLQAARSAFQPGGAAGAAPRQAAVPQPFTVVRDNVRLTLQAPTGGADLAALSLRLRVD
jgi:hypothetical protein